MLAQTLTLGVPAGAVAANVTLHVVVVALAAVPARPIVAGRADGVGLGFAYDFTAINAATHQVVPHFHTTRPLLLQLSYDPSEMAGIAPATLHVAYYDVAAAAWRDLPTTVDTYQHLLTAATNHFTLFEVRATARTEAQVRQAQSRLAALATAGPPRVSVLPAPKTALGGVPLVVAVPGGQQRAPLSLQVTGASGERVAVTYALGGTTIVQRLALDAQGYGGTAFLPVASRAAGLMRVTITVSSGGHSVSATYQLTLLPAPPRAALPPGVPQLGAALSATRARLGTPGPPLTGTSTRGATLSVVVESGGKPLRGVATPKVVVVAGTGAFHLRLPAVPRAALGGTARAVACQVVITASIRDRSTEQTLPLTVAR
jgi:hypothetical protein